METPEAVLIAGPTASGKSGLAVEIARRVGGAVVNADSMQVYRDLQILTARPTVEEMGGVPHHLYGHVDPREPYSVGIWLREVIDLLPRLAEEGRIPVFCGGTGLYFKALLNGLSDAPPIEKERRAALRARMEAEGPAAMHAELARLAPEAAARIRPTDPQRIVRALELAGSPSGTGLSASTTTAPLAGTSLVKIVLTPERSDLRAAIAERFSRMMETGAEGEAEAFMTRYGAVSSLATQAIGLDELASLSRGDIEREHAMDRAIARSRQYAKRQETWFRNQFGPDWVRYPSPGAVLLSGTWAQLSG